MSFGYLAHSAAHTLPGTVRVSATAIAAAGDVFCAACCCTRAWSETWTSTFKKPTQAAAAAGTTLGRLTNERIMQKIERPRCLEMACETLHRLEQHCVCATKAAAAAGGSWRQQSDSLAPTLVALPACERGLIALRYHETRGEWQQQQQQQPKQQQRTAISEVSNNMNTSYRATN